MNRKINIDLKRLDLMVLALTLVGILVFEARIGLRNYQLYVGAFGFLNYLNENIVMMLSLGFILASAVFYLYYTVGRLSLSQAVEAILLALIFLVWALSLRNRYYYYYGLILAMVGIIARYLSLYLSIIEKTSP